MATTTNASAVISKLTAATACIACPTGCDECKWNLDLKIAFCFKCTNDFDYYLTEKGVCLSKVCPAATIFNPSLGCEKCPDRCKSCERTSTGGLSCVECITGFIPNADTGVCEFDPASCPAKTVSVGTYCKPCPNLCTSCTFSSVTNLTSCTGCVTGYNVDEGQCVMQCPAGKFFG